MSIGYEHPLATRLLALAEARQWQLLDLNEYQGQLPTTLTVRGALVSRPPSHPLVVDLRQRGVPVVCLGRVSLDQGDQSPSVIPDRIAIGRAAAEHFAQRGFRHVAFIAHPSWKYYRALYRGLAARARELGCAIRLGRMHGERPEDARNSPEQWRYQQADFTRQLRNFPKPIGLLASSDVTASRYCRWVLEAGLRVPEDVAVLGVGDNQFLCLAAPVPISSVAYDWDRIADTAADMLVRLMDARPVDAPSVLIPPRGIITRRSTDVLAATDPLVVRALRYIWDHIAEDLTVDQIARHVGVSRRTLERSFQHDLGRGIYEEFKRRRLDKARELLVQSDLPIAQVASALNFSSHTYFGQLFRAAYGSSPADYRKQQRHFA